MKSFFRISNNFLNNSGVGFMHARRGEEFVLNSKNVSILIDSRYDWYTFFNINFSMKKIEVRKRKFTDFIEYKSYPTLIKIDTVEQKKKKISICHKPSNTSPRQS